MHSFKVIAFTHKRLSLQSIGLLHLDKDNQPQVLTALKNNFGLSELLYLNTCNRVELFIKTGTNSGEIVLTEIIVSLNPGLTPVELNELVLGAEIFEGEKAVEHVLKVASSLDSLVVGEREIITQVRKAYDNCNSLKLTGDFIRLLLRQTIETAKEIYTNTGIAKHPVSVASLAYRRLRQLGMKDQARIVFVGSGQTNTILANYFKKHRFANFTVFNRTLENAEKLSSVLNARAYSLETITEFREGFDVLVVCTGSREAVISPALFELLANGENGKKVVIDLGVPANVAPEVVKHKQVHYIDINSLKIQAEANLEARKNEVLACELIIEEKTKQFKSLQDERRIELAFGEIPKQVKALKELALNEVFAMEVNTLDDQGREVLDKVLSYMEKKYNAMAIKTAKEVFRSPDL